METRPDDAHAFDDVIRHVMALLYCGMREDAIAAGHSRFTPIERFSTHDGYHAVREQMVRMLSHLDADEKLTEFVLVHMLPEHRPPLH
jgi:hypothetical protein